MNVCLFGARLLVLKYGRIVFLEYRLFSEVGFGVGLNYINVSLTICNVSNVWGIRVGIFVLPFPGAEKAQSCFGTHSL